MKSGIYQILNLKNYKSYIGSSKNVSQRWAGHIHRLKMGTHHSLHLQNAWCLYGQQNFGFVLLEECGVSALIEREQYYIDTVRPEYNVCQKARSCEGITRPSETRAKMSISQRLRSARCVVSQETRARISAAKRKYELPPEAQSVLDTARSSFMV